MGMVLGEQLPCKEVGLHIKFPVGKDTDIMTVNSRGENCQSDSESNSSFLYSKFADTEELATS